jgi:site-specific recombinase XerC
MTRSTVILMLRCVGKRAGVSGRVTPHAFQHAFVREFILNGGDIRTVPQILGHTQITVTKQFYAVWSTEELKGQHERLSPVARLNGGPQRRDVGDQVTVCHVVTFGQQERKVPLCYG